MENVVNEAIAALAVSCLGVGLVTAGPIRPEIKEAVVFVYVTDTHGLRVPNGTGFLVGVRDPADANRIWGYLVTAAHVVMPVAPGPLFSEVWIRLNRKGGGVDFVRLDLHEDGPQRNVFFHSDATVDLVAIPFLPKESDYDFRVIPEEMLTAKDELAKLNIREGTEVFFVGLLAQFTGEQRNQPIVRFGRVALVADEPVDFGGVRRAIYLLEVASYGGNSGAPVFFSLGLDRQPGSIIIDEALIRVAGIMMGTFLDVQPIMLIDTAKQPVSRSNLGIAAVTPAYRLIELLHRPVVEQSRRSP